MIGSDAVPGAGRRIPRGLCGLALLAALVGCAGDQDDLRRWMEQQRASTPTLKDRVPPPKEYPPFRYENTAAESNPFLASRIGPGTSDTSAKQAQQTGSGPRPDPNRRREALESFPLDNIRMVGHLSSGGRDFALLQVDSMIYQTRVGNYVGTNHGRIVKVTEGEVTIRELVLDAAGDWTERDTALRLQEGRK